MLKNFKYTSEEKKRDYKNLKRKDMGIATEVKCNKPRNPDKDSFEKPGSKSRGTERKPSDRKLSNAREDRAVGSLTDKTKPEKNDKDWKEKMFNPG